MPPNQNKPKNIRTDELYISVDRTTISRRGKNIICCSDLKSSPPVCHSLLWETGSDSRLYHWVKNCGQSSLNSPGFICKFSIKAGVWAGKRQCEWITKIRSLPLMMSTLGVCTPGTQWNGSRHGKEPDCSNDCDERLKKSPDGANTALICDKNTMENALIGWLKHAETAIKNKKKQKNKTHGCAMRSSRRLES